MKSAAALLMCAAGLAACAGGDDGEVTGAAANVANVSIVVDDDGKGPRPPRSVRLLCDAGDQRTACLELIGLPASAFEPVPRGRACTEVFGGPQTARITGTVDDRRIDARYARHDGCEVDRWEQVEPILAAAR